LELRAASKAQHRPTTRASQRADKPQDTADAREGGERLKGPNNVLLHIRGQRERPATPTGFYVHSTQFGGAACGAAGALETSSWVSGAAQPRHEAQGVEAWRQLRSVRRRDNHHQKLTLKLRASARAACQWSRGMNNASPGCSSASRLGAAAKRGYLAGQAASWSVTVLQAVRVPWAWEEGKG
jgi:hypothetical protein